MNKLGIEVFEFQFNINDYEYFIKYNHGLITLKKIKIVNNKREESIIIHFNETNYKINIKPKRIINIIELDNIINDILYNINNQAIINGIFNIKELEKIIKSYYIKILISDGTIGLSNITIDNLKSTSYQLDIILLETNSIIGTIYYINGEILLGVKDIYKKKSLELYNELIFTIKNDKRHIKILENNSN